MVATTEILMIRALDGLAARADLTAENIANAGTPNFRPFRLSFEGALRHAAGISNAAAAAVPLDVTRVAAGSPEARERMDLELAGASATALRYGALIDVLGREMQFEQLAISGNV